MNWRTTGILALALLALMGLWQLWRPSPSEIEVPQKFFPEAAEEYVKIEIQPRNQTEIILERRPEPVAGISWLLTKPVSWPVWEPHVFAMVTGLRQLSTADGAPPDSDRGQAGLDAPEIIAHVHVAGKKRTVRFGRKLTQDPTHRWYTVDGTDGLFFAPDEIFAAFNQGVAQLRHKGIVFFDQHRVVRIELHETFDRKKEGQPVAKVVEVSEFEKRNSRSGQPSWYWVRRDGEKVEERLDEQVIYAFLGALAALPADDFLAIGDPAAYGFDKPGARFRLWLKDAPQPIGVLFGKFEKKEDKEIVYVQAEGAPEAAVVQERALHYVPRRRDAFRSTVPWDFAREEVQGVEIASALGKVGLRREEKEADGQKQETWKVVEPAGFKADEDALPKFADRMLSMRIRPGDGFLGRQPDLKLFALDPPVITLTFQLKRQAGGQEQQVFRLGYKGTGDAAYLLRPGSEEVFGIHAADFKRLDKLDLNFRSKVILNVPIDSLQSIYFDLADDREIGKRDWWWIERQPDKTWKFRDSIHKDKDDVDEAKLKAVLQLVNYLQVEEFVSRREEDAREHGLLTKDPPGKLEIKHVDSSGAPCTFVVRMGSPIREGVRYGMMTIDGKDDPIVFMLRSELVPRLRQGVVKPK